jgi:excisionase family DNA binding protein
MPSLHWQKFPHAITQRDVQFMPDEILTLPEVAQLLKVAEMTAFTMAQKSDLPAFNVRSQWRRKRDDIVRWVLHQKAIADASFTKRGGA